MTFLITQPLWNPLRTGVRSLFRLSCPAIRGRFRRTTPACRSEDQARSLIVLVARERLALSDCAPSRRTGLSASTGIVDPLPNVLPLEGFQSVWRQATGFDFRAQDAYNTNDLWERDHPD